MKIVIIGLSITSSWGNGHATTYRALVRELVRRNHSVLFLERDVPWYAPHRDYSSGGRANIALYESFDELTARHEAAVKRADAVIVGSYVPEGIQVCDWVLEKAEGVTAFYDIDTPVTLASLARGDCEYLAPRQVSRFELYLSFAGGRTLRRLEVEFGARRPRPLYCSVDTARYFPENLPPQWDLGYLGTFSEDRQAGLDRLLVEPARAWPEGRFAVAGPQYPPDIAWPSNVERRDHLPPGEHRQFYNRQRFTLNITRQDMIRAGHSPSVRLFEAAACGTPIISDYWEGLGDFFEIGREILIAEDTEYMLKLLLDLKPEEARAIGTAGRARVLAAHTAEHRVAELEKEILAAWLHRREPATL